MPGSVVPLAMFILKVYYFSKTPVTNSPSLFSIKRIHLANKSRFITIFHCTWNKKTPIKMEARSTADRRE